MDENCKTELDRLTIDIGISRAQIFNPTSMYRENRNGPSYTLEPQKTRPFCQRREHELKK